ncbi:DUF99 family protein [Natronomonas halophila]|uniref:endonuclease dU n=1 Tax=Natronomonas halophila TaxID=2747817 RepID=UPI0015B3CB16|nr:DUF99 family protein [Natronomonas halophila]QLD85437.1 DUF99 family protein [Natronomonas halophila]
MKSGRRALGIAESYRGTDDDHARSTLAGAVVRADRAVDDFVFGACTVGGRDATEAIIDCWQRLDRPDVQYCFLAGIAPAWYNIVDVEAVAEAIDRPVIAVSFEESEGLGDAIREAFEGEERRRRLDAYGALPERRRIEAGSDGGDLFVRSVGLDAETTETVVRAYTHERRPEPLRVAKRAARRADAARDVFRRD